MRLFILFLFTFLFYCMSDSNAQVTATINAPNMVYKLTSPPGWYFYQSEVETTRFALLIPKGKTRDTGNRFIYALDVSYEPGYDNIDLVVKGDLEASDSIYGNMHIEHDSIISIDEKIKARIIYFSPFLINNELNRQANAYIDAGTCCLKISFAVIEENAFLQYMQDFEAVVHSYVFIESWGMRKE